MGKHRKTLDAVLRGTSDANVAFSDLVSLLTALGFQRHIRGDHYIFHCDGVDEIINIQPRGSKAKPYQMKQIRGIVVRYRLGDSL